MRCVLSKLASTFPSLFSPPSFGFSLLLSKETFFPSDFRQSWQFDVLLLWVTTPPSRKQTHMSTKPQEFAFVQFPVKLSVWNNCWEAAQSESVFTSSLAPRMSTSHQTSEAPAVQGWKSSSHTDRHTPTLHCSLYRLLHSNTDSFLFLSTTPLFSFSAPLACAGRLNYGVHAGAGRGANTEGD